MEIHAQCRHQALHSALANRAVATGGWGGSGKPQGLFRTTDAALRLWGSSFASAPCLQNSGHSLQAYVVFSRRSAFTRCAASPQRSNRVALILTVKESPLTHQWERAGSLQPVRLLCTEAWINLSHPTQSHSLWGRVWFLVRQTHADDPTTSQPTPPPMACRHTQVI